MLAIPHTLKRLMVYPRARRSPLHHKQDHVVRECLLGNSVEQELVRAPKVTQDSTPAEDSSPAKTRLQETHPVKSFLDTEKWKYITPETQNRTPPNLRRICITEPPLSHLVGLTWAARRAYT